MGGKIKRRRRQREGGRCPRATKDYKTPGHVCNTRIKPWGVVLPVFVQAANGRRWRRRFWVSHDLAKRRTNGARIYRLFTPFHFGCERQRALIYRGNHRPSGHSLTVILSSTLRTTVNYAFEIQFKFALVRNVWFDVSCTICKQ